MLLIMFGMIVYLTARGLMGVPYVRTKNKVSKTMLDMVGIKPGNTLVDFGSGDGSILINAAKKYGAKGVGYEHLWLLSTWARLRVLISGQRKKVKIVNKNFFKETKLPAADAISIYLFPEVNILLEPLLQRDYPKGTKVISRTFIFPTLELLKEEKVGKDKFYLYQI